MKRRLVEHPRLLVQSLLAGAQIMTAGSVLADALGPKPAALLALTIAAAQTALASYNQGAAPDRAVVGPKGPIEETL